MKFILLSILLSSFTINAQEKKVDSLYIPVDKYIRYENCCTNKSNTIFEMGQPIRKELRIYGYENESNVKNLKLGIVQKIILNKYDKSEVLIIKSDEIFLVYTNLTNTKIKEGDQVFENQILGKIITTDNETYLGFQVWRGTEKLNPIEFLKISK